MLKSKDVLDQLSSINFIFINPKYADPDAIIIVFNYLKNQGFPVKLVDSEIRGQTAKQIVVDNPSN